MKLTQFGAPWCTVCKQMTPTVESVVLELNLEYEYVDADVEFDRAAELGIKTLPAFLVEHDNGVLVQFSGGMSREEFITNLSN